MSRPRLLNHALALLILFAAAAPLPAQSAKSQQDEHARAQAAQRRRLDYAGSPGYAPLVPSSKTMTRVRALLKQKKFQEALDTIDGLLEKNPVAAELHAAKAQTLQRMGRSAGSKESSQTARALQNATMLGATSASFSNHDTAFDTITIGDLQSVMSKMSRKIVSTRNETHNGHSYTIVTAKWDIDSSAKAETRDYYFNIDRIEAWRKTRPKKSGANVRLGTATVVTDDDSGPRLLSTTGGGGSDNRWPSFAALKKAADEQNPAALYELGQMYLDGSPDTPKNITSALLNLEDAARLGHVAAHFRLGKLYADGTETPRDYAKAITHYTAAARAGDPIAQHNLGAMISSGRGVQRNYSEGLAWLILAGRKNAEAAQSEQKLRAFLTKRPDWIDAGEKRAVQLEQELAASPPPAPKPAATERPRIEPPKIDMTPLVPQPMPIAPIKPTLP